MTKSEASKIPELQIFPDELVEDCFYYKLALSGRMSEEAGRKAFERLRGKLADPCYKGSLIVADMMIRNIDKYGVACAAWCD